MIADWQFEYVDISRSMEFSLGRPGIERAHAVGRRKQKKRARRYGIFRPQILPAVLLSAYEYMHPQSGRDKMFWQSSIEEKGRRRHTVSIEAGCLASIDTGASGNDD
jgi:hypothetical protein